MRLRKLSEWEKDLQKKLDIEEPEFPDAWNPESDDSLLGTIMNIREPTTQYGPTKVWEVKGVWIHSKTETREEGTWSLWRSTVLQRLSSATIGAHVGIKYLGIATGEKGRKYKNYKVEVLPP